MHINLSRQQANVFMSIMNEFTVFLLSFESQFWILVVVSSAKFEN